MIYNTHTEALHWLEAGLKLVKKYRIGGCVDVKANHGGIKSESVEDTEAPAADLELSMTPARQRRPAADADDSQLDSEDQLIQPQHDVTVCFCSLA